jgi:Trk K+ transport system NAD-binding subunit
MPETLHRANIDKARAVIAVTNDDAANLGVTLAAKQTGAHIRTITRVFDPELAHKFQAAARADAVFGASVIAAPTFVASACYPFVRNAFVLDDLLFAILDRPAGGEWEGWSPSRLRTDKDVGVFMRTLPGAEAFVPLSDDTPLDRNERVLAIVWRTLT